jgi:phenylacetate-coenzyme A ligase PaaK-like adenylate-forming protein
MTKQKTETVQKWQQFTQADAEAQETKLKETIIKAAQSPIYKKLWKTAHFKPENFQGTNDLKKLPYLSRKSLFEATRTKPNSVCVGPIGHWFVGHDSFNVHEWYPYSNEDFLAFAPALSRLSQTTGLRAGDVVLAVVDTPPRISSFIPFLWTYAEKSRNCGLEFINGSLEWYDALGMSWITFIQKRRPTAILASKKNAVALAEKLKAIGANVKDVLPDLRVGIFFGEGSKDQIKAFSAAETFGVFSPVEHMAFWSECKSHKGIHAWLDTAIIEVLADGATEAQLLSKSAVGTEGELVITNFLSSLPLVRYKTGKRIRVENVGQCSCGSNHPRVTFLP